MTDGPASHLKTANLVTLVVATFGLLGAAFGSKGSWELAISLGILAVPGDMLDGALARKLGQASPFGARLDSLADLIAFGVLPASLVMNDGVWGLAGLVYVLAAAWRLAWYEDVGLEHVEVNGRTRSYFRGVPVPFVAGIVLCVAATCHLFGLSSDPVGGALLLGPFLLLGPLRFHKNGPLYRVMAVLLVMALVAVQL